MEKNKDTIVIISPKVARHLNSSGFQIIDIKKHKYKKGHTVFIFKRTEALLNELTKLTKTNKRTKYKTEEQENE